MELMLAAALIIFGIVTLCGSTMVITHVLTLIYARTYYCNGHDTNYRRAYLSQLLRGSRPWQWLREAFRHSIVTTPEYDAIATKTPDPVIYACRPHGMLVVSAWLAFLSGAMDRPHRPVVVAVHSAVLSIPIVRELILLPMGIIGASEESILNALSNGLSVAIMPGGVKEMGPPLFPVPDVSGAARLAQRYGITIVDVQFDGEEQLCWVWHGEWRIVKSIRRALYYATGLPFAIPFFPRFWNWPQALVTRIGRRHGQ